MWLRATPRADLHRWRDPAHGVEFPLTGGAWPPSCLLNHNCIRPEDEEFVDTAVAELVRFGAVKTWDEMESVQQFIDQLHQGARLFVVDITSAYFHVPVAKRFWTLIAFQWRGTSFCFVCLPFGLRISAYVFCALAGVTANYIRNTGLTTALTKYCDDFLGALDAEPDFLCLCIRFP